MFIYSRAIEQIKTQIRICFTFFTSFFNIYIGITIEINSFIMANTDKEEVIQISPTTSNVYLQRQMDCDTRKPYQDKGMDKEDNAWNIFRDFQRGKYESAAKAAILKLLTMETGEKNYLELMLLGHTIAVLYPTCGIACQMYALRIAMVNVDMGPEYYFFCHLIRRSKIDRAKWKDCVLFNEGTSLTGCWNQYTDALYKTNYSYSYPSQHPPPALVQIEMWQSNRRGYLDCPFWALYYTDEISRLNTKIADLDIMDIKHIVDNAIAITETGDDVSAIQDTLNNYFTHLGSLDTVHLEARLLCRLKEMSKSLEDRVLAAIVDKHSDNNINIDNWIIDCARRCSESPVPEAAYWAEVLISQLRPDDFPSGIIHLLYERNNYFQEKDQQYTNDVDLYDKLTRDHDQVDDGGRAHKFAELMFCTKKLLKRINRQNTTD